MPWDLRGRAQPPVRAAFERGDFGNKKAGPVLDCGCGAGDNANWLAARGHDVLGFDFCAAAVAEATARSTAVFGDAIERGGGTATFVEASCLALEASAVGAAADEHRGFPVALDSALLHCLDDASQRAYVGELAKVVRVGGRVYVGCFSDANPDPWSNPRRLSEAHLRNLFQGPNWAVLDVNPCWYERPPRDGASKSGGAFTMAYWCAVERRGAL